MLVREFMNEGVIFVGPDTSVYEAAKEMTKNDISVIVVADEEQRPLGMISRRDIVQRVVAVNGVAQTTKVSEIMTAEPFTSPPDAALYDVVKFMGDNGIWHLPITSDEGTLLGIVALDDIMVILISEIGHVADILTKHSKLL